MGNFNVYMMRITQVIGISLFLLLVAQQSWAQACNAPLFFCQSGEASAFSTDDGAPALLPPLPDFCFESTNTIFLEFHTLSQDYITENSVNFNGQADLQVSGLDCGNVPFGTPGIEVAVVTASQLCNPLSFSDPLACEDQVQANSISLDLNNLLPDTTYYVIINTEAIEDGTPFDCDFNISVNGPAVEYNLNAAADPITIISGETSNLTSNAGFENYQWSGPELEQTEGQNTSVTLEEEGLEYQYNLTAEVDGCEIQDEVIVQVVPALSIPNTMTPNGDGYNDTWDIGGLQRFPDAEVRVYSRWGQIVHRTRGYQPWDGGGLPEAVYYYVIDLNPLGFESRPYTGYLTIIR